MGSFKLPGDYFVPLTEEHPLQPATIAAAPILSPDEICDLLSCYTFGELCSGTGVFERSFAARGLDTGS